VPNENTNKIERENEGQQAQGQAGGERTKPSSARECLDRSVRLMVSVYKCNLLDSSGSIIGTQLFRGTDDEAAIRFAMDLGGRQFESCRGIELWQGDRLVMRRELP